MVRVGGMAYILILLSLGVFPNQEIPYLPRVIALTYLCTSKLPQSFSSLAYFPLPPYSLCGTVPCSNKVLQQRLISAVTANQPIPASIVFRIFNKKKLES